MKAILIIFLTFHFDAAPASSSVVFVNIQQCEAARVKLTRQDLKPDGWGRPRLVAVCVEQ